MTSSRALIMSTRVCVAFFCAVVVWCALVAEASGSVFLTSHDSSTRFSNGLLAGGGLDDVEPVASGISCGYGFETHAVEDLTVSESEPLLASAKSTPSGMVLAPYEASPSTSTVRYNGSGYGFTQDVVVRGSVALPSIKTLQFWGNGYSGSGHVEPVGGDVRRVNRNNTGASIGMNIPLGVSTFSGFYNYHRDREFLPTARVEQKDNSYGLAYYLNVGGFYLNATGLYGTDKYSAKSGIDRSSFDGSQCAASVETGYNMMTGGLFVLEPFASYTYTNVRHDTFDPTTLEVGNGKKKYNACRATLGSRVNVNLAGLDSFTLQGRMAWITELRKRAESTTSFSYGRVPGTFSPSSPYFVGNGGGKDLFWAGCGLRLSLWGMLAVSVDYDCLFNSRQKLNEGSFGLLFGF